VLEGLKNMGSYEKIRANLMDSHVSYVDICLEKMWSLNADDTWDFSFDKADRWWDGKNEIDIVAIDSNGKDIIFGECKYWNKAVGTHVLDELEQKADKVNWKKSERRIIVAA
jgi:AAA+ ATPase superfamily predicted ATPase